MSTTTPSRGWDRLGEALGTPAAAAPTGWDRLRAALGGRSPADEGPSGERAESEPAVGAGWSQLRGALAATSTAVLDPADADDRAGDPETSDPETSDPETSGPRDGAEGSEGKRRARRLRAGRVLGTRRRQIAAAATAAVVVAAGAGVAVLAQPGGGLPGGVAFAVDGDRVSTAAFTTELQVRQTLYGIQAPATTDTAKYHAYLTSAAQAEAVSLLLDQVAPAQGVTVSTQTAQSSLDQAVTNQYGGDQTKFAQALGAAGLNQAQVLTEVGHNLVYQKLFTKIVGTPAVSGAQVQQYFTQHQAQLAVPETRAISHIVVSSQQAAETLISQIKGGSSFATLASAQSLDTSTKSSGGALGNYAKADLQPAFAAAAFAASPGVAFGPVQEQSGWDVGLVTAVHPGHPATLDATTSAAIKTIITDQEQAAAWDSWLGRQIRSAHITYAAAYRPASPDQPPQIPVPQLTGETLAGVGPAQAPSSSSTPSPSTPAAGAGG